MSDKKLNEIAQKFRGQMEDLGLGVSISVGNEPMVEIVPPPCVCGHVHSEGRSGSCSKFTCDCRVYQEATAHQSDASEGDE